MRWPAVCILLNCTSNTSHVFTQVSTSMRRGSHLITTKLIVFIPHCLTPATVGRRNDFYKVVVVIVFSWFFYGRGENALRTGAKQHTVSISRCRFTTENDSCILGTSLPSQLMTCFRRQHSVLWKWVPLVRHQLLPRPLARKLCDTQKQPWAHLNFAPMPIFSDIIPSLLDHPPTPLRHIPGLTEQRPSKGGAY